MNCVAHVGESRVGRGCAGQPARRALLRLLDEGMVRNRSRANNGKNLASRNPRWATGFKRRFGAEIEVGTRTIRVFRQLVRLSDRTELTVVLPGMGFPPPHVPPPP